MPQRSAKGMGVLIFGGLALAAVSRLLAPGASLRTLGHVIALALIALLGYRYAASGLLSRAWGILAFVVAWFWMPVVPLIALWGLAAAKRSRGGGGRVGVETEPASAGSSGEEEPSMPRNRTTREALAMKLVARAGGRVRGVRVPFSSPYGHGVVPVLLADGQGERGIYVEPGPWTSAREEECLRWLGRLRASERRALEVEIHSDVPAPDRLTFYSRPTPRANFELVGLLEVRVFAERDCGPGNAGTVKRLAQEHFGRDLGGGMAGLEALDELVVEELRPGGQLLPSTILLLGCFFGENLIDQFGGRWDVDGSGTGQTTVELASTAGTVNAMVFGKVTKLFNNGIEDSTLWMAKSIADRLRGV